MCCSELAMSLFLFVLAMYRLTVEVRVDSPWTMVSADGVVISCKSREEVKEHQQE